MSNPTNQQPWWHRNNKQTLQDRVNNVQNVNDPTIMSDDILRWSKVALYALLAFTTLLSGFSYFKFFEKSFGFELALCMALLLACIIEFGKNWGFLRVLRIPFFQGWSHIWSTVANTILWGGLLALAVVTFSASVYNSTQGAKHLSLLLGHEKNATVFQPNTSDIDAQITAAEKRIADNRATRWKGTTTVDAQRAIKTETRTLETLQKQRETRIQQQRDDYDRQTQIKDSQNNFSANSLLAVGGWVELLQIILMFVRVSAERSLDKTASERRQSPLATTSGHPNYNGKTNPVSNEQRFYFNRSSPTGDVQSVLTTQPLFPDDEQNGVSHRSQSVTHQNAANAGNGADDAFKLTEKEIRGWAANFNSSKHKDSTVSANINSRLDDLLSKMHQEGFVPSRQTYLKFYVYVTDTLFPMLNEKGWPYERQTTFEQWLLHIGSTTVQPA